MSESTKPEPFETALAAILDELADPERQAEAATEAAILLEATARWPPSESDWTMYKGVIRPQLLVRPLTRRESERIAAHIRDQMRKLPPRPIHETGTSLPMALRRADSEIAVPVLLDLVVHHWKRFTTAEMDQLLKALEYHLWCAGSEPTYVLVEQLRGYPGLRKTLRRIAHRHLGTADYMRDVPSEAAVVDGEVGVLLAPEELRSIRDDTHWLRRLETSGQWEDPARSLIAASRHSIFQCVATARWLERQGGDSVSVLVLAPDDSVYELEMELDEAGAVIALRWASLSDEQRADHEETVQLLKRVQQMEQEERERLGRVPRDREPTG
ncbi:MAG: hypothetical protein L0206_23015 [Actinobacteria bacterium]|nr:hypothetical protein [Actinomycetota bacterium]